MVEDVLAVGQTQSNLSNAYYGWSSKQMLLKGKNLAVLLCHANCDKIVQGGHIA